MKRLLLLGGGHAHVHVLDALARAPLPGVQVTLVTPYPRQIYSGMLPGWIAGHYPLDALTIPLAPLAAAAGATLHLARGVRFDPDQRVVHCDDGSEHGFDWLSIDTGPTTRPNGIAGADTHALPIRPIEAFIPRIAQRLESPDDHTPIAIVGGGAAGFELACALRARLPVTPVRLIGADSLPLGGLPTGARELGARLLAARRIDWLGGQRATDIEPFHVSLADGGDLTAGTALLVTGAAAPAWPAESGLAVDAGGFIRVGPTLQSESHPHILAAGDIAAYASPRPKSGVFAVRAGPPLAANLRALAIGQAPQAWQAQRRALYLISTGDGAAMGVWGRLRFSGRWVWRWKDRIDRRFMARFSQPSIPTRD